MFPGSGYSLYGQKMRADPSDPNPNLNNNNNRNQNNFYQNKRPNNYYQNNNNNNNNNFYNNNNNNRPNNNFYQNNNNNDWNGKNSNYQIKIYNGNNRNMNKNKINYDMPNPNSSNPQNNKINNLGKKYADLEVCATFRNDNNNNLSAKDLETKKELDIITNQFMDVINNINELSGNGPKAFSENNQLNNIKQELNQIDSFIGNEYSNFIGELLEVSKNDKVLNLSYDTYKKDPKNTDEEIKKIISDFKYDIVLYTNKDNTKENIKKLNNYIDKKTNKVQNNNNSINNFNNNNDNYNKNYNGMSNSYVNNFNSKNSDKFSIFDDSDLNQNNHNQNNQNNNYSNNYNRNNYNGNNNNYNSGNNNYNNNNYNNDKIADMNYNGSTFNSGSNNIYNQNKPKYEDPNDISGYANYNYNFEPKNKAKEKIKVQFNFDKKESMHEIDPDESGEIIQIFAMEEKDDPKIYTLDGRHLSTDMLLNLKVGEIFKDCDPILNIY